MPSASTRRLYQHWALGLVGLALLVASNSGAEELPSKQKAPGFYDDRADGWHWYEDPPPPDSEESLAHPPLPMSSGPPSQSGPEPMSAAWLREMLPVLRDAAIDSPTNENVAAYFYAQRIMFDKAQVFSDKAQQVVNSDPLLDEDLRLPFAAAAKVATLAAATDMKSEIVNGLAEKVGLWVFYDETCVYCASQIGPINMLASRHGLTIHLIHKQGGTVPEIDPRIDVKADTGQFDNLGVRFTPTVMMVVPPDGYYKISQGFAAYSELVDKLVAAANEYGLIPKDKFYAASPMSRGVLDVSGVDDQKNVDWNNTQEWVPFIRNELAKTYGVGTVEGDGEKHE